MGNAEHWNTVYGAREEHALTWFETEASLSLQLANEWSTPDAHIIDVGGGASRFVDGLLARQQAQITVLDLSAEALARSRERLGDDAAKVEWIAADITTWQPKQQWTLWHDRAVFHFLTERDQRHAYVRAMEAGLAPEGIAIIATFAPDGPEKCSNLPVMRWSSEALAAELDALAPDTFQLVASHRHIHITPKGNQQPFEVSVFKRVD